MISQRCLEYWIPMKPVKNKLVFSRNFFTFIFVEPDLTKWQQVFAYEYTDICTQLIPIHSLFSDQLSIHLKETWSIFYIIPAIPWKKPPGLFLFLWHGIVSLGDKCKYNPYCIMWQRKTAHPIADNAFDWHAVLLGSHFHCSHNQRC